MNAHRFSIRTLFVLAAALSMCAFASVGAAAPRGKPKAEAAKPVGEVVEYDTLEHREGAELVIQTTLKTTRHGMLMKYTRPALTLKLDDASGGFELTVPRETIKTITVLAPAKDAAAGD